MFRILRALLVGATILPVPATPARAADTNTEARPQSDWKSFYRFPGRTANEALRAATELPEGGYVAAGLIAPPRGSKRGRQDGWVVRADPDGEMIWQKATGNGANDSFTGIAVGVDGRILAIGDSWSGIVGRSDGYSVLLDKNGEILAEHTYDERKTDQLRAVAAHPAGGYVLAGHTKQSNFSDRKAWLIRADATGKELWSRTFKEEKYNLFAGVAVLPDGGMVLVGATGHLEETEYGKGWMVRLDPEGKELWKHTLNLKGQHELRDVVPLPGGGFAAAGSTFPQAFWEKALGLIVRFDERGTVLWERTMGKKFAGASAIAVGENGVIHAAGNILRSFDFKGMELGVGVVQTHKPDGTVLDRRAFGKPNYLSAIVALPGGRITVFGTALEEAKGVKRNLSGVGISTVFKPSNATVEQSRKE